jgi:hypothetical protein
VKQGLHRGVIGQAALFVGEKARFGHSKTGAWRRTLRQGLRPLDLPTTGIEAGRGGENVPFLITPSTAESYQSFPGQRSRLQERS